MINGQVSFWWSRIGGPPEPRSPLQGSTEADVAIVGAGYTGLWTAWYLARAGLAVTVLEREVAGWGASGRNGGWLNGEPLDASPARPFHAAVDAVADWCAAEGVDCDLVKGGSLVVATNAAQLARLAAPLSAEDLTARVRVQGAVGALSSPHCARIDPVKLVLGLREAVVGAGAALHEGTAVIAIAPGAARTPAGEVKARFVVRATEGYTAGLPGHRRALVPLNSAMVVTEPLGADVWAQIGWEGCECVLTGDHAYCYLQRTADGRIAIGGRGRPYRFGSRIDRAGEVDGRTAAELRARLVALFPAVRDVGLAHAWSGVLGVPRDWRPSVGLDRSTGLAWAGGYAGRGVAAANLAGRTLRDLVLGEETELTRLPWVGHRSRPWEPEPLRWPAINAVHALYRRADGVEARTGRASRWATVADRIAGR